MDNKKMVHIRLDENTYKKLMHVCIEKGTSIQKYVEGLIRNDIENKKMH